MPNDNSDLAREGAPLKSGRSMAARLAAFNRSARSIAPPSGDGLANSNSTELDLANAAVTLARLEEEAADDFPPEAEAQAENELFELIPLPPSLPPEVELQTGNSAPSILCRQVSCPKQRNTPRSWMAILK